MPLPEIGDEIELSASDAKQDKIMVDVGKWHLTGITPDIQMMINALGPGADENPEAWFRRPSGRGSRRQVLEVTSGGHGGHRRAGVPLFGGSIVFRQIGRDNDFGDDRWRVEASLAINPTRFVRYQPLPPQDLGDLDNWPQHPPRLRRLGPRSRSGQELVLNGDDNVIPGLVGSIDLNGELWDRYLRQYWEGLTGTLDQAIRSEAYIANVRIDLEPELNLKEVETYWEFAADDPLDVVGRVGPLLGHLGINSTSRSYPSGLAQREQVRQMTLYRVRLRDGVQCVLYAKTNRRVRLEIRHDLRQDALALGGGHTSRNWRDLYRWISMIAEDAATEANTVLRYLRSGLQVIRARPPVYQFLARVFDATDGQQQFENVVSVLVNNGVLRPGRHDPLREVVYRLLELEVLVRPRPRTQSFAVAPRFRTVLEILRAREDWPRQ